MQCTPPARWTSPSFPEYYIYICIYIYIYVYVCVCMHVYTANCLDMYNCRCMRMCLCMCTAWQDRKKCLWQPLEKVPAGGCTFFFFFMADDLVYTIYTIYTCCYYGMLVSKVSWHLCAFEKSRIFTSELPITSPLVHVERKNRTWLKRLTSEGLTW
jgi:hypothetical protein